MAKLRRAGFGEGAAGATETEWRPRIAPSAAGIATAITALRAVPADQLLDLAIAKLRALVPTEVSPPHAPAFRVELVPAPRVPPPRADR